MKKFKVHYHTTCDEHGQPHEDVKEITCADEEQAEMMISYDLDISFPKGENTIKKVEEVK